MKAIVSTTTLAILSHLGRAASPSDQAGAHNDDLGTFKNPSARARPRFRYWVPDASVNLTTIAQDVADTGQVGAGGVELLGFYNYGLSRATGVAGTDWTKYGWGTPTWSEPCEMI